MSLTGKRYRARARGAIAIICQVMSRTRQPAASPDDALVRTFGLTFSRRPLVPPAVPGWHQLVYAARGVVTVHVAGTRWVVPPQRALWVPAGCSVRFEARGPVALRSLYVRETRRAPRLGGCRAVNVGPLLRELILHVVAQGALRRTDAAHVRLAGVLLDQLALLPAAPLELPEPRDARARRAATIVRDAGRRLAAEEVARAAGASRRTLERLFVGETGFSLGRWIERATLLAALERLAAGEPSGAVAAACGYASASAFGAMFRRVLGETPGRYFA